LLRIARLDPRLHRVVQLLAGLDSKQCSLQAIKSLELRCLVLMEVPAARPGPVEAHVRDAHECANLPAANVEDGLGSR
jgi:hypothetical protein